MSRHSDSAATELSTCPFCGSEARLLPMPNARDWWRVQCVRWQCGGTTYATPSEEEAVAAWNRRCSDGEA